MSTRIHWQDKTLLRCSNRIFSTLYYEILDLIDTNKILLNQELEELINRLDLCRYGWHSDLSEYIKTDQDLLFFTKLTRKALDKYNKECQEWLQSLEKLDKELIEIGKYFPGNIIVSNGENTIILRSEIRVIEVACFGLEKALKESNLTLNENVTKAINKLLAPGNDNYHLGSIMAKYLHTKEDAQIFTGLIRNAVTLIKQESHDAQKIAQDLLEGYYQELVKISESFSDPQQK